MWTLGTVLVNDGDFGSLEDAEVVGQVSDESAKAAHEAKKAAKALIKSGVLGGGQVRVTINGHANKGFKDDGSSGPDYVQIGLVFDDLAEVPTAEEMAASRGEAPQQQAQAAPAGEVLDAKE